ncbi:PH domain-containing protein [Wenjunlia tyrosinilytica]|jgi:hypothetical protein|uniref:Membrane protein n=1 Tax=Wenjunlia tyrosinilytica TaxID=1544741 RepID=A0A918DTE7_9ACTN|nr:PH domain-containing protein [Wenjunlia tyrosinilytica]GGO83172.1 membrane protein [Wenjunlia tyrosinilytica]
MTPGNSTERPQYAPRAYRSASAIVSGVLLLALAAWLVGDAVYRGEGRAPWLALAGLLLGAPLVIAFTFRPAVFAGEERLVVRNPFRTITLPWSAVVAVRAGYSAEVLTEDAGKFQLWAIPVSLRQRKRAARRQSRVAAEDPFSRSTASAHSADAVHKPVRAWSDQAVDELRELAERNKENETASGEVSVRWAFEVLGPALAGAAVLAVLLLIG